MILGLTGSLGSGKSTVAALMQEMADAVIIDADEIAKRVVEPTGAAYQPVLDAFGPGILAEDGPAAQIDRAKLASLVFGDREKRFLLNSIVHPAVRDEELRQLAAYQAEGRPLIVLMVPLLLENRMQGFVDKVVVVTLGGDEAERKRRLLLRSGMTAEEADRRLAAQMPEAEKVGLADIIINNGGTLEQTREQVREALANLDVVGKS